MDIDVMAKMSGRCARVMMVSFQKKKKLKDSNALQLHVDKYYKIIMLTWYFSHETKLKKLRNVMLLHAPF